MTTLNQSSPKKMGSMNPTTLQGRWRFFSTFARLNVGASGGWGPACRPYQHVLQLLIENPLEGDESWTVYRNNEEARKDGKIVSKRWDSKADWAKLLKLEGKNLPEGWHEDNSVSERQFPIPSRWLKDLDGVLSSILIPPIAGPIRPFSNEPEYKLSLWRSRQESQFSWKKKAPAAWRPLEVFFFSFLRNLRKHAEGENLFSPRELLLK